MLVQQIGFRSSLNNPVSFQQFYYHCYRNKLLYQTEEVFVKEFLLVDDIMKLCNTKPAITLVRGFLQAIQLMACDR